MVKKAENKKLNGRFKTLNINSYIKVKNLTTSIKRQGLAEWIKEYYSTECSHKKLISNTTVSAG